MGYRTVVVLNNDMTSEWGSDPSLGKKIMWASSLSGVDHQREIGNAGTVLQCVHTDQQSLVLLDGLSGYTLSHKNWVPREVASATEIQLLKLAADTLGYRLVRKSK